MRKWILGLVFLATFNSFVVASGASLATLDQFNYSQYFVVKEDLRASRMNLLSFNLVKQTFPLPSIPYKRVEQFGTWIREDSSSCMNTRAFILQRESKSTVTFTANGCTVKSGQWDDVYTANEIDSADGIQIDHVVPLKNAYMSGAFEWDYNKRCLYANFLGNRFHLLAVSGKENMKKGDRDPHEYMPPNKAYTCEYLKHWLQIKLIWSLRLTPSEVDFIKQQASESNCSASSFVMSQAELNEQRRFMSEHADICAAH